MKNLTILLLILITFSCKAQTPIIPLDSFDDFPNGAYYKDVNNDLTKYAGTWQNTQGNSVLTIVLQKKEMIFDDRNYHDMIIGEYKYVQNGVEVINTLSLLNDPAIEEYYHNISGYSALYKTSFPNCEQCSPTEIRRKLHLSDPQREYLNYRMVLQYINATTIKIMIYPQGTVILPENAYTSLRVPDGVYVMTKVQ